MPTLRVHDAGGVREYLLGDRTILGRDRSVDVFLRANAAVPGGGSPVGRRHAAIERRGLEFWIYDAGSRLGVVIDGAKVERQALRPGDVIMLADVRCEFLPDPPLDPATVDAVPVPLLLRVEVEGSVQEHTIEADTLVGDFTFAGVQVGGGIRRHARLVAVAGLFWLEALDGSMRVGEVATPRIRLEEGLQVDLGGAKLTVRRRGVARLRVYAGEDPQAFTDHRLGARTRIGTRRINDIVLADNRVTREHCVIGFEGEVYSIQDLHSTNGVLVNGERVESRALRHGDRVTLGQTTCVFLEAPDKPTPAAAGLTDTFERAELPAPPLPEVFAPLLQVFAPWWFGTRRTRGLYQYGGHLLAEADDPGVPDYLIVGHAGHGVNSYALHYFLRTGPLLVVLELGAFGADADAGATRRSVEEAWAAVTALLAAAPRLMQRGAPRAGLRVSVSTLRGSQWSAGAEGGHGDWAAVLQAAVAWAGEATPFVPRPIDTVDVPKDSSRRPPASEAVARVRVYMPGVEAVEEHAIGEELVIGRHTSCEVHVPLGWVSRRHCRMFTADGFCWIEDLGSAQGTRVEGQTIKGACLLSHGARVSFGQVEVVYCEAGCSPPPRVRPDEA